MTSHGVQPDSDASNGLDISFKLYMTSPPHVQVYHHQSCTLVEPGSQFPLVSCSCATPCVSSSHCSCSRWTQQAGAKQTVVRHMQVPKQLCAAPADTPRHLQTPRYLPHQADTGCNICGCGSCRQQPGLSNHSRGRRLLDREEQRLCPTTQVLHTRPGSFR